MPKILKPEIKKLIRDNNDLIKGLSEIHKNCQFASVYQMLKRNSEKIFNVDSINLISSTLGVPIDELTMEVEEAAA